MTTDSTVAPRAHAIDPKMFLDYFTACGGGYCLTPDRQLWLGILQTGISRADRSIAAQIMREVKPADAERIKAYLEAKEKGESEMADNWSAALTRFRIAEREHHDYVATDGYDEFEADRLCATQYNARMDLLRLPAPDRSALLWKLEFLFHSEDGWLESWSMSLIEQTIADCRRLLVEG